MESTSIASDNFVRQILQSTTAQQMKADKDRLLALIQIKAQQTNVDQKAKYIESSEGSLDVYA